MKKLLSTLALVAIAFTTINAQNVNVTEKYYGARKGGFALSFGADPIVNFVGNMFNGTTKQEFEGFKGLGSDLFKGATISGKYMLKDDMAITLGLGFNNEAIKNYEYDSSNKENETAVKTNASHNFMLLAGVQKLLLPGQRLQPVLGLNIAYCYSNINYNRYDDKTLKAVYAREVYNGERDVNTIYGEGLEVYNAYKAFMDNGVSYEGLGDGHIYMMGFFVDGCMKFNDDAANINWVKPASYTTTETMKMKWSTLQTLEDTCFTQIILGEKNITAFDEFVEQWYKLGGTEILAEHQALVDAR